MIYVIAIVPNASLLLELAIANVYVSFVHALNIGNFVEKIEENGINMRGLQALMCSI